MNRATKLLQSGNKWGKTKQNKTKKPSYKQGSFHEKVRMPQREEARTQRVEPRVTENQTAWVCIGMCPH